MRTNTSGPTVAGPRGFSLIELLVVVLIISVVLAIVIPVLGGVRQSARKAATLSQMAQLQQASVAFESDNNRLPGVFSVREMGDADNATRGMSAMSNIILDLAGGVVEGAYSGTVLNGVGPTGGNTVRVAPELIGSQTRQAGVLQRAYFTPDLKNFVVQDPATGRRIANADNAGVPELVDAFGTPILAWVQDSTPSGVGAFASENTGTRAQYYWVSNRTYLQTQRLGRFGEAQAELSLLSSNRGMGNVRRSLEAVLGDPSYPLTGSSPLSPANSRGAIVFHAAGPDGVFFSLEDTGGRQATGNVIEYTGDSTLDPIRNFDDQIQSVGR